MSKHTDKWIKVTNEFVVTFADKDCTNCQGEGYIVNDGARPPSVCSCATIRFRENFLGTPRCKVTSQRIGNRDVTTIWYKPLAVVKLCTCGDCTEPTVDDGLYGNDWCNECLTNWSATGGCSRHDKTMELIK